MSHFSIHNHTEFSVKDGFGHVNEMLDRAIDVGLKGIAFTEHNNTMSLPYAYKLKASNEKYKDLKIVYGSELYECFDINVKDINNKYFHLIVLAKNEQGRVAINRLITDSEFYGKYVKGRVDLNMMKPYANDLIVSTACLASKLSRESDYNKCIEYVNEYKSIFPHFYLEMQSHDNIEQELYNKKIMKLAKDTNTKFIITTDSHAPTKEMLKYQARHVQISQDKETMSECYEGCYVQSDTEIHEIMDKQIGKDNVDIALKTTLEILDLIDDNVSVPFQNPILPKFDLPEGFKTNTEYLTYLCENEWNGRKFDKLSQDEQDIRRKRLEYELSVIDKMNFAGYFLIVWDALNWGRDNGVEIGRGRGSAGGSIVCYLTHITDVDPIKYGLIFERFLNPERVGLPDVDTDLSPKEKVIQYLKDKYGRYKVCQVMNLSYITPLMAIKDTARVLDRDPKRIEKGWKIGATLSNELSKFFTDRDFNKCIEQNWDNIPKKFKTEMYDEVYEIARMLSGRIRQTSTHAGGVGIVDTDINEYMPMHLSKDGEQVIQVDKHYIEDIGIVKFDFLGLGTLNIIKEARELANLTNWDLDPNNPKFENDKKSYELLSSGNTNCVFQVESQGMKDLLTRLKPNNLDDVCVVISLYRPDSMNVLEDYIAIKSGEKESDCIHEDMKEIFKDTYFCMVYQEQLMEVVRKFGGRTYGGADKFRKGIGKKDVELVKKESNSLYNEIIANGYNEDIARKISDEMASKGGYMFNKSHGIEYAVNTLTTAYLKANYPVEFFCAVLNQVCNDGGKVNKYILDAQSFGVKVVCPHINKSKKKFTVVDGTILFGFNSINGIGDSVIDMLIEERDKNGKFTGLDDLLARVKLNKAQVVALIKSGALPTKNKKEMIKKYAMKLIQNECAEYKPYSTVKSLPTLLELKTKWGINTDKIKDKNERLTLYNKAREIEHNTIKRQEWEKSQIEKQKLIKDEFKQKYMQDEAFWEFESLSIFLENNPFKDIQQYVTQDFYTVEQDMECIVIGVISSIQKKKDRNKKDYAYIRVYESEGILEGLAWNSVYTKYMDLIKKGNKLAFYGTKNTDETFIVQKIKTIEQWIEDRKLESKIKL